MKQFEIRYDYCQPYDYEVISLYQALVKYPLKRRRMAKRFYKKTPLFAFEMMCEEWPDYTKEQFLDDISPRRKSGKRYRKSKTPLVRCGRYPEMKRMLNKYYETHDFQYLQQAQSLRNRMWLPWVIIKRFGKQEATFTLPYTASVFMVKTLASTFDKCQSYNEAKVEYDRFCEKQFSNQINDSK